MAQVLVRDLDDWVVARLKERARIHERSLEGELRVILREAAGAYRPKLSPEEAVRRSRELREQLAGRPLLDSAELIREDRDSR